MNKFNAFTVCPLVIDSPLQQEQDKSNAKAIFDFILSGTLPEQQLVLGTIPGPDIDAAIEADDSINVIRLDAKYGLLQDTDYDNIAALIEPMHLAALSVKP